MGVLKIKVGGTYVPVAFLDGATEPPGVVKSYAGYSAPTGYLMCDGTAVSRTTYDDLFAAITISITGNTHSGTASIDGLSSTANLEVGMPISGPGVPAGSTIATINTGTSTVTITGGGNATATATGAALVIAPWGVGDGSTTFNIPDGRDRELRGKNALRLGANEGLAAGSARDNAHDHAHSHAMSGSTSSDSAGTPSGSIGVTSTTGSGSGSTDFAGTHSHSPGSPSATFNAAAGGSGVAGQGHSHSISGDGSHSHAVTVTVASHSHIGSFSGSALGGHSHSMSGTTGASTAYDHPYLAVNWIIKV